MRLSLDIDWFKCTPCLPKVNARSALEETALGDTHYASPDAGDGERPQSAFRAVSSPCPGNWIEVDATGVRRTTSTALLGTNTELLIQHNGTTYRLTLTRFGKLILHK